MSHQKQFVISILFLVLTVILTFGMPAKAASVYAIPEHWQEAKLNVYDIQKDVDEGKLEKRATYNLLDQGACDVTIDVQSNMLFVTFEFENYIELIDARTFLNEGYAIAVGATDLAGVVFSYTNPSDPRVFTVDRGTAKLFEYDWDAGSKELTLLPPNGYFDPNDPDDPNFPPFHTLLSEDPDDPDDPNDLGAVVACGLALDSQGRLYVSQYYPSYSSVIHVYDTTDNFRHIRTIDLNDYFPGTDNYAVDLDVDSDNGWLYAGGYTGHHKLIRFDLENDDPATWDTHVENIGAGVIGLAISPGTRFLYMTTYNYLLEAWDTNMPLVGGWEQIDSEPAGSPDSSGGAGVCIADVDYVPPFSVDKISDVNEVVGCVVPRPGEEITYTISYEYNWTEPGDPNLYAFSAIHIEDYLPDEVDFVSVDPNNPDMGYYDDETRSYVWVITPENYGSPSSFDITVELNNKVTPGEPIENTVVEIVSVIGGQEYKQTAQVESVICECADSGKTIYVDQDATNGGNDGTSWTDAYVDLQSALREAFPCDQIWVAEGAYIPAVEPDVLATFGLVNAVGVYGGFDGTETEVYERDWFNNETILSGYIDPNEVDFVVTADDDIRWAILDGFTITRGLLAGVCFEGGSVLLEHNFITDNGIGILCNETQSPKIRNNWIYDNVIGMSFVDLQDIAVVRNNTVVDNDAMGVYCDSDIEPSIENCIFWGHADANDLIGCYATYSCIEYPTHFYEDPNETIYLGIGEGNIDDDPLFETGDYHLSSTSPCINAGDPNETYYHQRDIDKEFRVLYGRVDMGADEYYDCSYVSDADFNEDGIVNFPDYGEFAQHWLETVSDPNWDSTYDLAGDDEAIDVNDLALFAGEWLWMDCDTMTSFPMEEQRGIDETYEMMMMSSGSSAYGLEKAQAEPTLKEQIDHAQEIIDFFERHWKKDKELRKTIAKQKWNDFIDKLYEWFYSLEDLYEKEQHNIGP